MDQKDRFGSALRHREQAEENLYFQRLEQHLREQRKAAEEAAGAAGAAGAATLVTGVEPSSCPHCHVRLAALKIRELPLYECGSCGRSWMDAKALHPFPAPAKPQWIGMLADYYTHH